MRQQTAIVLQVVSFLDWKAMLHYLSTEVDLLSDGDSSIV